MVNVSIARRYARALLEAAGASSDRVLEQLQGFVQAIQGSRELTELFTHPAYTRAQKSAILEALLKAGGEVDRMLANLLRLLVDRHRLQYLPDIARVYRDLADQRAGRVRGKVTSAVPLAPDALSRLEHSLQKVTQRDVVLESAVDPRLLGGVSAQVGSLVFDGSLRAQLEDLRRTLA